MKTKLEEVVQATKKKDQEGESSDKGKENIDEKDIGYTATAKEKGKEKEIGIKIKELAKVFQIQYVESLSDVQLERKNKEREALDKMLEKRKNEVAIAKMNNKIKFLNNAKK